MKDRFKLLRMQEEAGIKLTEDFETEQPLASDQKENGEVPKERKASSEAAEAARQRAASIEVAPTARPTLDDKLAPGTAVGTSTGPAPDERSPVDWDLWQSVVYEGPAAVSRTSPDEMSHAIALGIPSAIRGVVWQVLAQSQSAELTAIYYDLANRSTEKTASFSELKLKSEELKRQSSGLQSDGAPAEKSQGKSSAVHSSASSMHSAPSSPSEPNGSMTIPPTDVSHEANSMDAHLKVPENAEIEKRRRSEDEADKLQKLDRAIRRDLGARTSYSKFLMSQGLQTGLHGLCKAYALYDEEVGYAQGMNFIAMPILFNVSPSLRWSALGKSTNMTSDA